MDSITVIVTTSPQRHTNHSELLHRSWRVYKARLVTVLCLRRENVMSWVVTLGLWLRVLVYESVSHVRLFATPWAVALLPDSSVHRILQAIILEWVAIPFSGDLLNPGIESRFPILQADSLTSEPPGKPLLYEKCNKFFAVKGLRSHSLEVTKMTRWRPLSIVRLSSSSFLFRQTYGLSLVPY